MISLIWKNLYHKLLVSNFVNEDDNRRALILNIILLGSIILLLWSSAYIIYANARLSTTGLPNSPLVITVLLFCSLYLISRRGHITFASYAVISIYFIGATYGAYHWGIDLPASLLSYGLLTVLTSILINPRFSFFIISIITVTLILLVFLENNGTISPARYWETQKLYIFDAIQYSFVLFVIAIISWLSNREIARSLLRARTSEAELKQERDSLEAKVEQRTEQLRQLEIRRVTELHRLAEHGKLAAGYFHDLMNPLTAITLTIEQMDEQFSKDQQPLSSQLRQAISASRRTAEFISAVRQANVSDESITEFSLNDLAKQVLHLLNYKARKAGVKLIPEEGPTIRLNAKASDISQIIHNLACNAIEAYAPGELTHARRVIISVRENPTFAILTVTDYGRGMTPEILDGVLKSGVQTPVAGVGLAIVKNLVEQELGGTITLASDPRKPQTTATVTIPKNPTAIDNSGKIQ